jgi:N-acylglucosamine 2-epimerase
MQLEPLLNKYRHELLVNVIPFWMNHAIDRDGGINTCIRDDGKLVSRDRWGWSQWRALWVFSKLYNSIEPRDEWLELAHGIYRRMRAAGLLPNGHWALLINENGNVERGFESIYTDGFAIYGLVEYWRATGDEEAIALAESTFRVARECLHSEESPPAWPYPIPSELKAHGVSMLFSLAFHELAVVTNLPEHRSEAILHHEMVMNEFLRSDRNIVLEWLSRDGGECQPPQGTAICPGHAIESMWFQILIAQDLSNTTVIAKAVAAIRRHLELGWDPEFGGLLLAVDSQGRKDVAWPHADTKLWWPQVEALVATLYAYEHSGEAWCLEWHGRVHDYSFAHYPIPDHGEWKQKLDRRGIAIHDTLFLPVKDPFHLPRALIQCIEVLTRHLQKPSTHLAGAAP